MRVLGPAAVLAAAVAYLAAVGSAPQAVAVGLAWGVVWGGVVAIVRECRAAGEAARARRAAELKAARKVKPEAPAVGGVVHARGAPTVPVVPRPVEQGPEGVVFPRSSPGAVPRT